MYYIELAFCRSEGNVKALRVIDNLNSGSYNLVSI